MNKFMQRLALFLIDRRMKKAAKKNGQEYADLRVLRANIVTINNFWQGTFAPYGWKVKAKEKYIEKLPPVNREPVEELPLSEEEQYWADMSLNEFMEEIHGRTSK